MGFAFSSRVWIRWMAGLNPAQGLLVYYMILYLSLYVLSRLGLVVFGLRVEDPAQTLGLLMVTFSFFIIVDWESAYIQHVSIPGSDPASVSSVFYQSEDGATFWLWQHLLPGAGWEAWRFFTYVFTPFALTLLGGLLLSKRVRLGA
jgi:hypothetical protein